MLQSRTVLVFPFGSLSSLSLAYGRSYTALDALRKLVYEELDPQVQLAWAQAGAESDMRSHRRKMSQIILPALGERDSTMHEE